MEFLHGLLVGFDLPIVVVLMGYLVLTPLLSVLVIAPVLESRWLPLLPSRQFLTFTVGDVCLAWFATWMTTNVRQADYREIPSWWVLTALVITSFIAVWITIGEYRSAKRGDTFAYHPRAVLSPTKLYHNLVLYAGYVWMMAMLLTEEILQGVSFVTILVSCIPLALWVVTMIIDGRVSDTVKLARVGNNGAHVANWSSAWQK